MAELPEGIREVRAALEPVLVVHPDVVGLGLGFRERGGERTEEVAIRVYVGRKRPAADVPEEHLIPSHVAGFPVDVLEEKHPKPAEDYARYDPLQGGIHMGKSSESGGATLGCLVRKGDGSLAALTQWHVVGFAAPGVQVKQPGVGSSPADDIGTVGLGLLNSTGDAALIELSGDRGTSKTIVEVGETAGSATVSLGQKVWKRGIKTFLTKGTVVDVARTVTIDYTDRDRGLVEMTEQVEVESDTASNWIDAGDSGAVVVDDQNRVVGIVAWYIPSGTGGGFSPIGPILSQLFVEVPGGAAVEAPPSLNGIGLGVLAAGNFGRLKHPDDAEFVEGMLLVWDGHRWYGFFDPGVAPDGQVVQGVAQDDLGRTYAGGSFFDGGALDPLWYTDDLRREPFQPFTKTIPFGTSEGKLDTIGSGGLEWLAVDQYGHVWLEGVGEDLRVYSANPDPQVASSPVGSGNKPHPMVLRIDPDRDLRKPWPADHPFTVNSSSEDHPDSWGVPGQSFGGYAGIRAALPHANFTIVRVYRVRFQDGHLYFMGRFDHFSTFGRPVWALTWENGLRDGSVVTTWWGDEEVPTIVETVQDPAQYNGRWSRVDMQAMVAARPFALPTHGIVKYDPSSGQASTFGEAGMSGMVKDAVQVGDDLYVFGAFTTGAGCVSVARIEGGSWNLVGLAAPFGVQRFSGGSFFFGDVEVAAFDGRYIWFAGQFIRVSGPADAAGFARLDTQTQAIEPVDVPSSLAYFTGWGSFPRATALLVHGGWLYAGAFRSSQAVWRRPVEGSVDDVGLWECIGQADVTDAECYVLEEGFQGFGGAESPWLRHRQRDDENRVGGTPRNHPTSAQKSTRRGPRNRYW